jgi:hypothetical protein
MSGRMVPAMTLITGSVPPENRGTFMGLSSCLQQYSSSIASLIAGAIVVKDSEGHLHHFAVNILKPGISIVDYTKKHFFSKEFFNSIVNELKSNLASAFFELTNVDNTNGLENLIDRWEKLLVLSKQHDLSYVYWLKYVPEVLEIVKNLYNSKIQDRDITESQSSPGEFSL